MVSAERPATSASAIAAASRRSRLSGARAVAVVIVISSLLRNLTLYETLTL